MNLPGPHQRIAALRGGKEGSAALAIVFRSRPIVNATQQTKGTVLRVGARSHREGKQREEAPAWHASVWDEVCETIDGALLRRIKILITDGPQLEADMSAWG